LKTINEINGILLKDKERERERGGEGE